MILSKQWQFDHQHWRKLAAVFAMALSVTVPLGLAGSLHLLDYLGPGLGYETGYEYLIAIFDDLKQQNRLVLLTVVVGLFIAVMLFKIICAYLAYFHYGRLSGKGSDFPLQAFWLFMSFNALMLLGTLSIFVLLGFITWLLGYSFGVGYNFAVEQIQLAHSLVMQTVPTLFHLPSWLAVLLLFCLTGFFHYWLHRLAHEFRLLWLLFHRPHHMPSVMIEPMTTGVIVAFPLGFILMFPYVWFFSALTKLFSAEPLYIEIILMNLVIHVGNVSAHASALYRMSYKSKLLSFIGHAFGTGHYHYVHHASDPEFSRYHSNLSNVGGGLFFMWDRLFGTYVKPPSLAPEIGLTGQPDLQQNPLQLLFAGIQQLLYEWRHNRGWGERCRILLAKSDYVPPVSRDFALRQ